MPWYHVFVNLELLEALPRGSAQRRMILDFVSSLHERPATPGDYVERDGDGRTQQIKIVGDYAVTYWPDDAVKTVMVTSIRKADRADVS